MDDLVVKLNSHQINSDPRDSIESPVGHTADLSDQEAQWLATCIRLRPELVTDLRNEHDGLFVVIEDPVRNKFYSVGQREFLFLSSLDGNSTVAEHLEKQQSEGVDQKTAITICNWAVQANLVVGQELNSTARLERQAQSVERQKLLAAFNPISIKFHLFNPNQLLSRITPSFRWIFTTTFLAIWLVVGIWAASCAWNDWERLSGASVGILSGYKWLWLLVVWVVLKVIHETAHGVACKKYGGDVTEAGVLLLLFTPMAFVNVTSSWRFANRWQRIVVAAAGMYIELFIAFAAVIVWSLSSDGIIADICYNIFFMSSVTTVLFNANPLMRFDGYYILADSLGITNLYTKGTKLFGDKLRSRVFGVAQTPNLCPEREQRLAMAYGTLAWFWKILISLSLIIGASVLFQGAGKVIAAIGVALFFGLPIWNQLKQLYGSNARVRPDSRRVAFSCALIATLIVSLFSIFRAPATKSAPAVVQFKDETLIRAECDGFIRQILVSDGDQVLQGQKLIVLHNPQIDLQIQQLKHDVEGARIQARVYRQTGEVALFLSERERLAGLEKQLTQRKEEADALNVLAPLDGFVFRRNLESKIGSFARQGDTLLNIAVRKTKEVVVAIDQRDWESLKGKSGSKMRVAIRSHAVFPGAVTHIDARATDVPKFPELCASAGGPLPVRSTAGENDNEDEESEYRLLSPHFYVDLQVDPKISANLHAGQRGRAFFRSRRQSLGSYIYVGIENWFKNKIEVATQTAAF